MNAAQNALANIYESHFLFVFERARKRIELIERAACMLESAAHFGVRPTYADGTDTPNKNLCLEIAKELRELQ